MATILTVLVEVVLGRVLSLSRENLRLRPSNFRRAIPLRVKHERFVFIRDNSRLVLIFFICVYLRNLRLKLFQCLTQILNQIVGMFQPNRQAQKICRAARGCAFNRGAVLDQAVRAAETSGVAKQF